LVWLGGGGWGGGWGVGGGVGGRNRSVGGDSDTISSCHFALESVFFLAHFFLPDRTGLCS